MNNASPATRLEYLKSLPTRALLLTYASHNSGRSDVQLAEAKVIEEILLGERLRESMAPVAQAACPKCGSANVNINCFADGENFIGCRDCRHTERAASPVEVHQPSEKDLREWSKRIATAAIMPQYYASMGRQKDIENAQKEDHEKLSGYVHGQLQEFFKRFRPAEVQGEREALKSYRTYDKLPYLIQQLIEPHRWDNMDISQQRDWALAATVDELEGRRIRMGLKPGAPLAEIAEMERLSATPQAPAPQEDK